MAAPEQKRPEFIPFAKPCLGEEEVEAVANVVRSGWLTTGPVTHDFEKKFADHLGVRHAIAVNSCTAGLHLGLEALGIRQGDIVVTTPFTFTATAEVIRYLGADVAFVDVEADTFNIDPEALIEKVRATDAKAVIPVHFGGQPCDMDQIIEAAKESGCRVMSDAAHAFPSRYKGKPVGSLDDDLTVFSFYANKTLCTGEGGMIVTDRNDLADRMKIMRLHGIDRDAFERFRSVKPSWYYEVIAPGFKYNMPDIAAAIGLQQLKKADQFRNARDYIARAYTAELEDLPVILPTQKRETDSHAWHLYVIRLKLEDLRISRNDVIDMLSAEGIGTSVHYIPLHMQPYWRDRYALRPEDFPVSTRLYEQVISLPIYPGLGDQQIQRITHSLRRILTSNAR